jgi:MYXO-CTERM domain-containing protein
LTPFRSAPFWLALVAGLVFVSATAAAQDDCERPVGRGPLRVTPASGAGGVTLDAPIKVEYTPGFFADTGVGAESSIRLVRSDTGGVVTGRAQVERGDTLFLLPDRLLAPSTSYEGTAFGIDFDLDFNFRTGTMQDLAPPRLGAIESVSSSRVEPRCEAPDGGYRVDVSFSPASDDGPVGSIEYLLFLTRGVNVDRPELRARDRNFTTDLITMAFVLEPGAAAEPVCVAVEAVDGVGRVDDDGEEVCFDPIEGNFFEPLCAVSPSPGSTPGPFAIGLSVAAVGLVVRRRRARRR